MPSWKFMVTLAAALALSAPAIADGGYPVSEGDFVMRNVTFRNGETLDQLTLHYEAVGTPQRDGRGQIVNAVMLLHGTTGTGRSFLTPLMQGALFGPGQPLDVSRYYVLLPDGIGMGGSSKPSDGLRARFPHYGYVDQVDAQRWLATGLGIGHLRLVAGISQGGMQTWIWGERYPDAMDGLMPLAAMPIQISGRNLLWRRIVMRAIETDPAWKGGDYDPAQPPSQWADVAAPLFAMMLGNPVRMQADMPDRAATLAQYDKLVAGFRGRDALDSYYDFDSSRDYDPAPDIGRIKAPLLAVNFADDMVNPVDLTVTRETIARIPKARFLLLAPEPLGFGHAAIYQAPLWAAALKEFLDGLPHR